VPERHRRDKRAEPDSARLAGQAGKDGPRVGGRATGLAGEAVVVVGAQERLEACRLGMLRNRQLVRIGAPLLWLDHQRETHGASPSPDAFPDHNGCR
jgi:hypothetical protein